MNKGIALFFSLLVCLAMTTTGYAEQIIVAKKVARAPVIDGSGSDEVWSQATGYTTYDEIAKLDVILKAVYTDTEIFFWVSFPDADRSDTHKTWIWDKNTEMYTFIFKWNMEGHPVDLSVRADNNYVSDIWFWKAARTDPAGYADDKVDRLNAISMPRSQEVTSRSGKKMYMTREGDNGTPAFKDTLYGDYVEDKMPAFSSVTPTGSRADVRAKGVWSDGRWTLEFGRALHTGNNDDIQFDTSRTYLFGVSRYEIAGRAPEPKASQPLYGAGDVSEALTLKFEK
jgi:Ethylbenzene dehydrogenase